MAKSSTRRRLDDLFGPAGPAGLTDLVDAKMIALDLIDASPHQARTTFDEESLGELAASIRERGVLQPIRVRPVGERYELVAGERRVRASRAAGLTEIPAIVGDVTPEDAAIEGLIENLMREDLNPVERANGLQQLRLNLGSVPWEVVGQRLGLTERRIHQLLDLTKLPAPVQERVRSGALTEKHTRSLKGLEPPRQEELASAVQEKAANPSETAQAARLMKETPVLGAAEALTQVRRRQSAPRLNPGSAQTNSGVDTASTTPPATTRKAPRTAAKKMVAEHELEIVSLLRTGDGRAPLDEVLAALRRDLVRFSQAEQADDAE